MFKRRCFLRAICGGALTLGLPDPGWSNPRRVRRPDFLFIMSDDHTSQAISAYGGRLARVCPTPNIDRIAREGMLFRNCFVTNSICTPSRSATMTGKYSHKNGVYKFTALDQTQPTLPKLMRKTGYHTALVGKYHLQSNPVGLDYWSVLPGQGRYHNPQFVEMGDESPTGWVHDGKRTTYMGYSSDVIADKTLDYLKNRRPKGKPVMFFCHFKAPHDTWEYARCYRDYLDDVEIPEPPNLFDDYQGRCDALKKTLQYIGSDWGDHTNFEKETEHLEGKKRRKMQHRLYMRKYLRCVRGVDDNVGRVLDYLDESGLAKNTIVMYTGDQGFFLGEHGLYDKRFMYEQALRMPFLVRWPGRIKPGSTSDGTILNVNFAPTILQAAGVKRHPEMQGRSFVRLLQSKTPADWRKSMYYRYYYSHFETESHFGVRTYEHKLVFFARLCAVTAGEFYAYYTRLPYMIPLDRADYIRTELDAESRAILDAMERAVEEEVEEGDEWYYEDDDSDSGRVITGKYADIVVNVTDGQQLVFARDSSCLPYWKTEKGKWFVEELVPRQKDIACAYSYARIIENTSDFVLIHWRYIPDLDNPSGLTGEVHEYFKVHKNGRIVRRIKHAPEKLVDYQDPANFLVQKLMLKPDGIEQLALESAELSRRKQPAVRGALVKSSAIGSPVVWWRFDEGLTDRPYDRKDLTRENISGKDCAVEGNMALWKKGISGTALAFDGYHSTVRMPASASPPISDEVTIEGWLVLGAYPWNWAPIVHQSIMDVGPIERGVYDEHGKRIDRKKGRGYYLGVDGYGYPIFAVNGHQVQGSSKLSTYRWTHVAATYGAGKMTLYVDGKPCASARASGPINVPGVDLLIGLNNRPGRATDPVRSPICHMPVIYGIEGLIDEVKIYDKVLSTEDVTESYARLKPDMASRHSPNLEPRTLPGETGLSRTFGATYKTLKYHPLWDNLWRPNAYADLVVKFDTIPTSVVYWRGANGAAGWVTENNKWMEDQSCEVGGPHGCSEHMADKDCRHAHVRLIESTDARVVVHWRYASIDVDYLFPQRHFWADEYHTIYPDGTAVRKVHFHGGRPG